MTKELSVNRDVRILRSGSCPTLNGKSKLTYEIGAKSASEIALRVTACSGGGFFSREWVSLTSIGRVIQLAGKAGLTSFSFRNVFVGKSVNTAGFLLAVLRQEGAVQLRADKSRIHEPGDFNGFVAGLRDLVQAGDDQAPVPKGRAVPAARKGVGKGSARRA